MIDADGLRGGGEGALDPHGRGNRPVWAGTARHQWVKFNPLHFPLTYKGQPFRHYVNVTTSYGLYVVIAGAAVALVGAVWTMVGARSRRGAEAPRHYSLD